MSSAAPRDATAFEAREALAQPGCAVCRLSLRSVSKLIASIAYEQVNDVQLRERLRHGGGFCNAHAHQWLAESHSVLGTALIYRDVLRTALRGLDAPPANTRLLRALRRGKHGEATCPACHAQLEAEARYLEALLSVVAAEPDVLRDSAGLCRRHTLAATRSGSPGATHVIECAREQVERTLADLDEVIRKEDYRFRHEPRSEAERDAPSRAVGWAAGMPGLIDG